MRKIIAVAVPKGGVGKTTTAVNLAASLAAAEKKTLLIDFDPSGTCSIALGYSPEKLNGDIFSVLSFTKSLSQVIYKTDLEYLEFIPFNLNSRIMEDRLSILTNNMYLFRNLINMGDMVTYDYIIIDCPPYLKGFTNIALTAANSILIPIKAGQFTLSALNKLFEHINWIRSSYNHNLKIEGIVMTMYESRTKAWAITNNLLKEHFGENLLKTSIPKCTSLTECEFLGKPSILINAKSKGSLAYLHLAEEIMSKTNPSEGLTDRKIS